MLVRPLLTPLLLAACVIACATTPQGETRPSRDVVARIESGHALLQNLSETGVSGAAPLNQESRVNVRNLRCTESTCTYSVDRCIESDANADSGGWCQRTVRFARIPAPRCPSEVAVIFDGWAIDPPRVCELEPLAPVSQ